MKIVAYETREGVFFVVERRIWLFFKDFLLSDCSFNQFKYADRFQKYSQAKEAMDKAKRFLKLPRKIKLSEVEKELMK